MKIGDIHLFGKTGTVPCRETSLFPKKVNVPYFHGAFQLRR